MLIKFIQDSAGAAFNGFRHELGPGGSRMAGFSYFMLMVLMLTLSIGMRIWALGVRHGEKRRKKYVYKRRVFTSPRSRVGARHDDLDLPSGFGGPSGYHVIKRGNAAETKDHQESVLGGD